MVVQKIKNGNNKNYFHFSDSHTVVKNHSNLMASVHVFLNFRLHFSPRTLQIYNKTFRLSRIFE